jgi:hypothetical protein
MKRRTNILAVGGDTQKLSSESSLRSIDFSCADEYVLSVMYTNWFNSGG